VHLRVLQFLLVGRLEFSETVIGHQTERLLLGLAVKDTQGSWETTRSEAVKVVLLSTFLKKRKTRMCYKLAQNQNDETFVVCQSECR